MYENQQSRNNTGGHSLQNTLSYLHGGITSGSYIIFKITTDEGIDGVGSSIGFPKMGLNRESAMAKMKSIASGLLLGQDPLNTEAILSRLDVILPGNWRIKAHIDYALYDLKGKILNLPVYQLLGGLSREQIPFGMDSHDG